jgi:hypothetical protein
MLRSHAALWESTGSLEMLVFHTLLAGNIGQFGAPGTVVVIATRLAVEDAGTTRSAAAEVDPAEAADACAVDAVSVAGAGAAEQAALTAASATIPAAAAAARTLTGRSLVGFRTVASWHGHSPHTGHPGELGNRHTGCTSKRSKAGIATANLQYSVLTWRHARLPSW